ncbi:hypothetical protein LJR164_001194 [Phenylobacterium sp. LjRoot164]|uniref:hypothetical protein n=1 Tax=unclassified Phenylobacterium TaxID=2640670 RepID=UPI003ED0E89F
MFRFAVVSAALLGVLFPLLETLRRGLGAWLTTPVTLLEDYVAGGLLLWAALALARRRPSGWVLMLAASAYATGMMSSSFWKQLEAQLTGETWEDNQGVVVGFKLFLWALPLILTIISAKAVLRERTAA